MMVLITYDVETVSAHGQKRLRKVAKICTNYGQRVQNSVFECIVNPMQLQIIKEEILKVIDMEKDSVRFYHMGSNWSVRVEHMGTKIPLNLERDNLII
ncbi:MAG: CRISPR-associated protein Cas2 [Epulopiscium sp.]|jgi:CRISPR-associated protein Cas2|nr:CRISPR-associated protein Cas2 [Eubacteriaceae bacterium]MDK2788568.1 CRISPR-associated protein Cas2 [Candidatus Epulonipiscium sp.]